MTNTMKNPFRLLEIEKSYILEMHRKYRDNFGTSLKEQLSSIKSENPQNVTYRYTHNGMTSTITFFSDGKYQSNRPLIANIRNLQGTWKYVPQTNGGGRIMYSSGGVSDGFIQEIGRDLIPNSGLSEMIQSNPQGYSKLPVMSKLANLENTTINSFDSEAQASQSVLRDKPGCPAGCVPISRMKGN